MGNGVSRAMVGCFVSSDVPSSREHSNTLYADPQDEGIGHSFCYIRPASPSLPLHSAAATAAQSGPLPSEPVSSFEDAVCHDQDDSSFATSGSHRHSHSQSSLDSLQSRPETTFKAISGASVSANTSTPCSIVLHEQIQAFTSVQEEKAAAFECTALFASLPLQPIPKGSTGNGSTTSGPISMSVDNAILSGALERGFLSGPLERSCLSGPIDATTFDPSHFSAPLPGSYVNYIGNKRRVASLLGAVRKPMKMVLDGATSKMRTMQPQAESGAKALHDSKSDGSPIRQNGENQSLQWAHGKAGEDRVHVVLSDKHGWLFVGIYDGFNGPDAPDFLMGNLYAAIYKELQGLLWDMDEGLGSVHDEFAASRVKAEETNHLVDRNKGEGYGSKNADHKGMAMSVSTKKTRRGMSFPRHCHRHLRDKENHEHLTNGYNSLYREIESKPCRQYRANHSAVLKALARALEETEKDYLDMADKALNENPELALMGSCILVMLMKDEDMYVMNVGDSRAIIAQHQKRTGHHRRRASQGEVQSYNITDNNGMRDLMMWADLERIMEENPLTDLDAFETPCWNYHASPRSQLTLNALQLSKDHCTSVEEEVRRIREEHPDDELSIVNDRVKGTLKVTRAFGAGFLKKPHWNDAILEMFRVNYVGSAPYINCRPTLCHYRLGENDRFLILSSDGLYQYLTNQEVVSHVESFMEYFPDGDPAQHLIEEVLFRAAKKAGMDFHELLDVPQGDRRKYHDDVSVMVISLQGRIWRSSS